MVRLAWPIAAFFTIAIPLWVSVAGREAFRLPKLVLFRTEGVVLAALLLIALINRRREAPGRWSLRDPYVALPLLICAWTAVVTVASPDPRVSSDSLITVVAGAAIYLVAHERGRQRSGDPAWIVLIPALVNAAAVFVEMRHRWDLRFARALLGEFSEESLARVTPFGFMGNRDDLGTLLVPAAILAIACAVAATARRRLAFAAAGVVLVAGVVASKTLTAIAALTVAVVVLGFVRSWKSGAACAVLVALLLPAAFFFHAGLATRGREVWRNLRAGELDKVLVGRITPNLAAAGMVRDHPVTGVGPGLFGRNYYEYRIEAAEAWPALVPTTGWIDYFLDAHNDHLQFAAEGGVLAWLLFLAVLGLGAAVSFRRGGGDGMGLRARLVAAPLFVALFVLALVQFPTRLGGTLQLLTVVAGLAVGWSRRASD